MAGRGVKKKKITLVLQLTSSSDVLVTKSYPWMCFFSFLICWPNQILIRKKKFGFEIFSGKVSELNIPSTRPRYPKEPAFSRYAWGDIRLAWAFDHPTLHSMSTPVYMHIEKYIFNSVIPWRPRNGVETRGKGKERSEKMVSPSRAIWVAAWSCDI
jgi:hypothetical protein